MASTRRSGASGDNANPNIAAIIAQQLQNIISQIVTQVTNNVHNVNANSGSGNGANGGNNEGCTYIEFLACKTRDFDGKQGAIALTRWIKKMESERGRKAALGMTCEEFKALLVEEFCPSNGIKKLETEFWNHVMVGANHAAYTLTDEAVRCGTLSTSSEKRKEVMESSKKGGSWTDIKRAKVLNGFVEAIPTRNEYAGTHLRCAKCNAHHPTNVPCLLCYNCQKPSHFARDCRSSAKNVALVNNVRMGNNQRVCYKCGSPDHFRKTCPKLNRVPGQVGNCLTLEGNKNSRNNGNQTRGRAFNVNAIEGHLDPNNVIGTYSLNDHFATVLFDSGANFSFISTENVPLLNVKPSILRRSYVIEVANGKKVETDKIIHGFKLELGDSLFNIDLIPFGHGSFDVIVGMDWLSRHKAEIVFHEKVVRIPLENDKVLLVKGEQTEESPKLMKGTKLDKPKLGDISIVPDFPKVFPEDLSGLPPQRQVEICIDLVPGATPIVKSPYQLAPSKMQEFS
ncbi:putative reverse transcriptase domain-containing protein [Tanacetum coccineum]